MSENNNVNKTNEKLEKYISESNKVTYNSVNREYKSRLFSFLFGGRKTNIGRCPSIMPFTEHPIMTSPA